MKRTQEIIYYDRALETKPRERLRRLQQARLQKILKQVLASNPFYRRKLRAAGIRQPVPLSRLAELPFTTKAELSADQATHPPYGTNLTSPLAAYTRLHQTSGTTGRPLRWLDTPENWKAMTRHWGFRFSGAGVRPGDRIYVAFSFGPFLGFWGAFEAGYHMGCLTITGGGQSSEQRLEMIRALQPTVFCSTPTYALRLAEAARSKGLDIATLGIRTTIHGGEPGASIPATRRRIEQTWGAKAYDTTGMTEVGSYGYECQLQRGPHVVESDFIMEVIDPQTGRPVAEGEQGELVLTSLTRSDSPLIRYRTGDTAKVAWDRCECGRTFARLPGGILGRADDMIVVRGINIFPSAIENILAAFPQISEFQGQVVREREMDELVLRLEVESLDEGASQELSGRILGELRTRLSLRPQLQFVPPGTLSRAEMKSRRFHALAPGV